MTQERLRRFVVASGLNRPTTARFPSGEADTEVMSRISTNILEVTGSAKADPAPNAMAPMR